MSENPQVDPNKREEEDRIWQELLEKHPELIRGKPEILEKPKTVIEHIRDKQPYIPETK